MLHWWDLDGRRQSDLRPTRWIPSILCRL